MSVRNAIFIFLAIFASLPLFAQEDDKKYIKVPSAFEEQWKQYEIYGFSGLPNEQLYMLDTILDLALKQRNAPEFYRALHIYPVAVSQTMLESEVKHAILTRFEMMADKLEAPFSNMVHAFLAEQFQMYAMNWDMLSWGDDFSVACLVNGKTVYFTEKYETQQPIKEYHYRKSIENLAVLFQQKSIDYANSLYGDSAYFLKNPTLADVLAEKYLTFFTGNNASAATFDPQWFASSEDFLKKTPNEILKVYQEMELFHWKNKQLDAYTKHVLSRLDYIKRSPAQGENRNKLYLEALQWLKARLNSHPSTLGVIYAEAEEKLSNPANKYDWKNKPAAKDKIGEVHDNLVSALKQYPASLYAEEVQNMIRSIESKKMNIYFAKPNALGRPNLMTVFYQNVEEVYLHVYHIDGYEKPAKNTAREVVWSENPLSSYKLSKVHEQVLVLDNKGKFNAHSKDFIIPNLKKTGEYLFLITPTKDSADIVLNLEKLGNSSLAYAKVAVHSFNLVQKQNARSLEILVLEETSGKAVSGAQVFWKPEASQATLRLLGQTNAKGEFKIVEAGGTLKVVHGNDSILKYIGPFYNYDLAQASSYRFISDRNIYRPGQTVHFKAYAFEGKSPDYKVLAGHDIEIRMMDYEGTDVGVASGQTNEFGTFSGSFTLPKSGRTGNMYITVNGEAISNFLIEEYKRPGFEVEAKYDKPSYKMGDKVTVSGKVKAYSGYGISNSRIHVRIDYAFGYRYYYGGQENLLDTVIQSDAQGLFSVSFIAKTKQEDGFGAFFSYDLSATSIAGETQNASGSIFIGRSRSEWDVELPSQVLSTDAGYGKIALLETGSKSDPKTIEVQLWKQNPSYKAAELIFGEHEFQGFTPAEFQKRFPDAYYFASKNPVPQFVHVKTFNVQSGDSISIHELVERKAGNYELRLTYRSAFDTISLVQNFNYIDMESKKNQHQQDLWSAVSSRTYKPGDEVSIVIGSKYKKLNVLVEIYRGETLLRHEWMKVKGRKTINYKVQPEDLGGISVFAFAMQNSVFMETSVAIHVPFDSKKLNVKLETVREILRPGAQEKWIVSVSSPDGSPLSSELLAGMYDASLDQFTSNDWYMSVYEENFANPAWGEEQSPELYFSVQGKWDGRDGYYFRGSRAESMNTYYDISVNGNTALTSSVIMDESEVQRGQPLEEVSNFVPPVVVQEGKPAEDKVRTNFSETAFFYPQLTAKDNRFQFEFTLPDALTRWKFQALAHDKLMRFGYTSNEFVAQKELMADPNEPRFFRAGDDLVFAVDLVNLTDKAQNVTATLEWFDPYTNIVIPNVLGIMPNQNVDLAAKGMQTVNWTLKIPKTGLDLIAYRVRVSSDQFSDAEEKVIPILSNRAQMIESVPFTVDGSGRFVYELPKLLNQSSATQRNEKLVFEYNSNPLWSAVMAIPYIADYPYDCAEQVFSKIFANRISEAIIEQNPLIATVLSQPGTDSPEKFLSALETNEDLKSIILAETPWLLEAKSEAEQKRRISQLFEANNLQQQQQLNLDKLRKMQNPDGGWSWFAGGNSNIYITQHILSGFGHLRFLGLDPEYAAELEKAQEFLEKEYSKQFKALKKEQVEKKEGLTALHVQWLYTKQMLNLGSNEVSDYYSSCLERDWLKYPLHIQAMAGVYFQRADKIEMQEKIYKSILSKATTRKGLGTYWNENKTSWNWDRNAIETQASLIEFFKMSNADEKVLASMKLWLLNQKRGQYWESTKTTAWACYALLIDAKPVEKGNNTERIYLGNQQIVPSETGYTRETFSGSEIKAQLGKVVIDQSAEEPAFGSLNLIYTEEIDKISKNVSGMQLEKQIFLVRDGKEVLVTPATPLALGDLLRVRLQISSDRNLEFVHVKDLRASGAENVETLSGYRYSGNLYYYNANRDASTEFFLDNLPKGKHTITYDMRVSGKGTQSTGYAIVECLYAPEFKANSVSGIIHAE